MRKIDIFTHIWPKAFHEALKKQTGQMKDMHRRSEAVPIMTNLDMRLKMMDTFGEYQQILSLASPPPDALGDPVSGRELSKIGSDGMAELCQKYPDRFPSFIASIAMTDAEGAAEEARRAIKDLGACGVQIYTNVNGRPLDSAEFRHIFKAFEALGKPVWVHPARTAKFPDYETEELSQYEIWWTFGWPYESSAMQARLIFSKMLDEMPNLKVIIHHAGGMTPFFEGRVGAGLDQLGSRTSNVDYKAAAKAVEAPPLRLFQNVLRRYGHVWRAGRARMRPEILRRGSCALRVRFPIRPRGRPYVHPRNNPLRRRTGHFEGRSRKNLLQECVQSARHPLIFRAGRGMLCCPHCDNTHSPTPPSIRYTAMPLNILG